MEGVELPDWSAEDMPELHEMLIHTAQTSQGRKLSIPDRLRAACAFAILGSSYKVEVYTGIKAATVRKWYKKEWWKLALKQTRELYNDQLDAMMTQNLMNAQMQLLDRVREGDEVVTKDADGNPIKIRKKMSGRELATVTGILTDKRALLRGDATAKVKVESSEERLAQIADRLTKAAAQFGEFRTPETIEDAEYEEIKDAEEMDDAEGGES